EFYSKKPGAEPLTHREYRPGVKVSNNAAPKFSVKVYKPETTPCKDSFKPNTKSEVPG
ncbi:hypothetical protein F5883DRAFT_438454, partial [Diaporthe sp. PMI_573]